MRMSGQPLIVPLYFFVALLIMTTLSLLSASEGSSTAGWAALFSGIGALIAASVVARRLLKGAGASK